ncbi:MAG: hypothetical protein V4663_15680 [Bacteroidota bacterium]
MTQKRARNNVSDPTSTYEKHTPERVSSNVTNIIKKRKFYTFFFNCSVIVTN